MTDTIEVVKRKLLDIDRVASEDMRMRREEGLDWPIEGKTMIGRKRMDNLEYCMNQVIKNKIPGDVLEAGVWRGGACIFMREILKRAGVDKKVYVCDSFAGLPPPQIEQDKDSLFHTFHQLAVPLDEVKANFAEYDCLDDNVVFVKGWFEDTLPTLKGHKWALIRLDSDMYKSTMEELENLYDGLSVGGFAIIDDWGIKEVKMACEDFRASRGITAEVIIIDQFGAYWVK